MSNRSKGRLSRAATSWKLWIAVFLVGTLVAVGSGYLAVRAVTETLQSAMRVRPQGFGGQEDALDAVTRCCRFAIVEWETQQLARWAISQLSAPSLQPTQAEDSQLVQRFFALPRRIADVQLTVNSTVSGGERARAQAELRRLKSEQAQLRPRAQRVLSGLIALQLQAEGLTQSLPFGRAVVFPPVAFTITRPPSVLAVSPRERIALERSTVLEPGLTDEQILQMEREAEDLGWSAVVEPTGGYSTYPTIITDTASLRSALRAVAHEWTHTYLFFRPLGSNYFKSREMRTVNETVAGIVGRELSNQLLATYLKVDPPPARKASSPGFSFRKEMRQTRLETERLLAQGRVQDAEQYMEERRRLFVQKGYAIRKLNQAYFAFHGTYAGSPASVSPIGPQLEALFERAGSLRAFVKSVEGVDSFQDFQKLLEAQGVSQAGP